MPWAKILRAARLWGQGELGPQERENRCEDRRGSQSKREAGDQPTFLSPEGVPRGLSHLHCGRRARAALPAPQAGVGRGRVVRDTCHPSSQGGSHHGCTWAQQGLGTRWNAVEPKHPRPAPAQAQERAGERPLQLPLRAAQWHRSGEAGIEKEEEEIKLCTEQTPACDKEPSSVGKRNSASN